MRRFLTFELIVHLSDRDLFKVIQETDKTTILGAFKNASPQQIERVIRVFTVHYGEIFIKDLNSFVAQSNESIEDARNRISEIADRLLTDGDLEDWVLKEAS